MVKDIVDAVVMKQFKTFLNDTNKYIKDLTGNQLSEERDRFLKEVYDGLTKPPNEMVDLLTSPSIESSISNLAITLKPEISDCDNSNLDQNSINNCPSGWLNNSLGDCLKYHDIPKNFTEASKECQDLKSHLLKLTNPVSTKDLFEAIVNGSFNGTTSIFADDIFAFWIDAYRDGTLLKYHGTNEIVNDLPYFENIDTTSDQGTCALAHIFKSKDAFFARSRRCNMKFPYFCIKFATQNPEPDLPKFSCLDSKTTSTTAKSAKRSKSITSRLKKREANTDLDQLDGILNPYKSYERRTKIDKAKASFQEDYNFGNTLKIYDKLFEVLWYSRLPCFDVKGITSTAPSQMSIIKQCFWKGAQISCPLLFKTLPSDRGMCCAFNMEKAEEIYRDTKYSNALDNFQTSDLQNR